MDARQLACQSVPLSTVGVAAVAGDAHWEEIAHRVPQMAATMQDYLDQLAVSSRPSTAQAAALALRHLAEHITQTYPDCTSVAAIERRHIESYKLALAARPGEAREQAQPPDHPPQPGHGSHVLRAHHRLGLPGRTAAGSDPGRRPAQGGRADTEVPRRSHRGEVHGRIGHGSEPSATAHRRVARPHRHASGELGGLRDDAMYRIGDTYWLRIALGKLHNDRSVPLHPMLVGLINDCRAWRGPTDTGLLVERDDHQPFDRRTIHRYVQAVA